MSTTAIEIYGATLIKTPEGVDIKYSWFPPQPITTEDVIKLRDWLNLNFPETSK